MAIDKLVVLETRDTLGNAVEETTHFAWISIFRKHQDGEWKLECIASTNEPGIIKPL
jgi:ketosteroid isomerase-like protein